MSTLRHRAAAEVSLTLSAALALGLLALASAHRIGATGLDIVSSDSLYLPLLYEGSIFGFRLSSASNLFPDLVYYALARATGQDEIGALLSAGMLQCALTTALLARHSGVLAALAYNALYFLFGFPFYFSIGFHQGLIVMALFYLAFPSPGARRAMSLLFTIADPLFALVPSLFLAARAWLGRKPDAGEIGLIVAGYAGAFFLAESNVDLAKFAPVLAASLLAGWVATLPRARGIVAAIAARMPLSGGPGRRRDGDVRERRLCSALLCCASLGSLLAGQPARYALPLLVASIACWTWRPDTGGLSSDRRWFTAALLGFTSFALLYAMVVPALTHSSREALSRYGCLTDKLRSMQVDAVATDYWTFKPLYFVGARDAGLRLLQLDFRDGTPYTWVNAHRFVRGQSHFIVRNVSRCNSLSRQDRGWAGHCSDDGYRRLGVKARTEACGDFEIIETERPIDFSPWEGVFASKLSAFVYNFRQNTGKLTNGP